MIETGEDLRRARERLGWSELQMANELRLAGTAQKAKNRVREMEAGIKPITGPVQVAVAAFLSGWRP